MRRQELGRREYLRSAGVGVAALGSAPIWSWASEKEVCQPQRQRGTEAGQASPPGSILATRKSACRFLPPGT